MKSSGRLVLEAARSLAIAEEAVWNWVTADWEDAEWAAGPSMLTNALSQSELEALRRL